MEVETFGSYLTFQVNGTVAEIIVTARPAVSLIWIGAGTVVLLAGGFVMIRIVNRRRGDCFPIPHFPAILYGYVSGCY